MHAVLLGIVGSLLGCELAPKLNQASAFRSDHING